MKQNHYARKKRQLKVLIQRLHQLSNSQKLNVRDQIQNLIKKINTLVRELLQVFSHTEIKKILGATAILFGISFANQMMAQSFAPPVENPFGLVSTYMEAFPTFADLDGDGDFDLLVGEYYNGIFKYFENIGDASNPQFAQPLENPFGIQPSIFAQLLVDPKENLTEH